MPYAGEGERLHLPPLPKALNRVCPDIKCPAQRISRCEGLFRRTYKSYLNGWVKEKFAQHKLEQVRTMGVEHWLAVIELEPKSKPHPRNVLLVLIECAARWELIKENPITRVR